MRPLIVSSILAAAACTAPALASDALRVSAGGSRLTDAVLVRPLYGLYRHCEGACLKSGSLSWYCFDKQACHLSCATAPPALKCATP